MKKTSRWLALLGLATLAFSGVASASCDPSHPDPVECNTHIAAAATGLGQAWPNAADVSSSPNYHAYVFTIGGIQYVQVNDLNGNVLGAVGSAGGQFITLPVGRFAQLVSTPQQAPAVATNAAPAGKSVAVFQDSATTVSATPLSDGTLRISAASKCTDPIECSSRDPSPQAVSAAVMAPTDRCSETKDPTICNSHGPQVVAQTVSANGGTCDPVTCNSHNPAPTSQVVTAADVGCHGDPVACSSHNPQVVAAPAVQTVSLVGGGVAPADTCTKTHDPETCNTH